MAVPRIPAWKRLGLKLKYAQETEETPSAVLRSDKPGSNGIAIATNTVDEYSTTGHPPKRRRLDGFSPQQVDDTRPDGPKRSSSLKNSGSNALRKSVSFTPETKVDDGESSNFMQDKWDEEARNDQVNDFLARQAQEAEAASKPSIQSEAVPNGASELSTTDRKGEAKRAKHDKRAPEQKNSDPSSPRQPQPTRKSKDALEYLQQYQSSRSSWKFNKNREIWLLKHIFSKTDIPASYDSALIAYLSGIRSENAKTRLLDQCHDCIVEQVEHESDDSERALLSKSLKVDTTPRRLAYYRAANQKFERAYQSRLQDGEVSQEDSEMMLRRYERVDRAVKLLESMLHSSPSEVRDTDDSEVVSLRQTTSSDVERVMPKKRKNRTAVVEISSSEDTSSSDSDD